MLALFSSLRDKYDVIYKPRIAACKDQAEEDKRQGVAGQEGIWRPGIPEVSGTARAFRGSDTVGRKRTGHWHGSSHCGTTCGSSSGFGQVDGSDNATLPH